jgi:hypothetical protein
MATQLPRAPELLQHMLLLQNVLEQLLDVLHFPMVVRLHLPMALAVLPLHPLLDKLLIVLNLQLKLRFQ